MVEYNKISLIYKDISWNGTLYSAYLGKAILTVI